MSKKRKNSYYDEYDYNENYYDDDNYDNNEDEQKKKLTGFESEYDRDEYDDYNDLDDENFNNYDERYSRCTCFSYAHYAASRRTKIKVDSYYEHTFLPCFTAYFDGILFHKRACNS